MRSKPKSGIFRSAIGYLGFSRRTALFIDDKQENCDAAAALGMQTIVFQSPAQLCAALNDYGINI